MTSEDVDSFRTTFMFSPPDSTPTGWSLTFDGFVDALRAREEGVRAERWSGVFSGKSLSFVFTTSSGNTAEGIVGEDPNGVAVDGCTCAEAAEFAHWMQSAVLGRGTPMRVNVTECVEWELPPIELPWVQEGELRSVLTDRLREVLDYEEDQLG